MMSSLRNRVEISAKSIINYHVLLDWVFNLKVLNSDPTDDYWHTTI